MAKIPYELKRQCAMAEGTAKEIYYNIFLPQHEGMSLATFQAALSGWRKRAYADDETLGAGTYMGFSPHAATVQVNGAGEITQVWVKQTLDDGTYDRLLEAIRESAEPLTFTPPEQGSGMLEIPLFDLHFPLDNHAATFDRICDVLESKKWERIYIVIGQDLFHNDDFRGRTSKGTNIDKVDMGEAWKMARAFWWGIISTALVQAQDVHVIYSKGNHDESLAWAFIQLIKEAFPQAKVDDSLAQRKIIAWRNVFIGITHGDYRMSTNNDLRGQFSISFPEEFAAAKVREIHAGHLHHEKSADVYGVMCRRLSRGGKDTQWANDEGFVGAHPRFMLFNWEPDSLKSIIYV